MSPVSKIFKSSNIKIWFKDIVIIQIVVLVITLIWFHQGLLYGGGESGLPFYNPKLSLDTTLNLWQKSYLGFPSYYEAPMLPFFWVSNLLFILGLPSFLIQLSIHFFLISTGILSMYFFLRITIYQDFRYSNLPLFGSLFYFFNLYSMSQVWARGLYMQFIPFASLPLMLLLMYIAFSRRKVIFVLLTLLCSFIFSGGFTPAYILTFWLLIGICFMYFLILQKDNKIRLIFLAYMFLLFFGWIGINSWWLSALFLLGRDAYLPNQLVNNDSLGTLTTISRFSPFFSVIRLIQKNYFNTPGIFGSFYQTFFFQILSWITPILVIFSLKSIRKSKHLGFFLILLLFSLFICLGTGFPFGFLFVWVFNSSAVFQVFRNPFEKFGIVLLISYTPFVTLGFFILSERISKSYKKLNSVFSVLLLVALFIILVWPIWTGLLIRTIEPKNMVQVPDYYSQLNKWMDENNISKSRIVALPFLPGEGVTYSWGGNIYSGIDPMRNIFNYSVVSSAMEFPHPKELLDTLYKNIDKVDISNTFGLLRAKYLVIRDDVLDVSKRDLMQEGTLLRKVYTPQDISDKMPKVCQNEESTLLQEDHITLICQIPDNLANWSGYRYLHLLLRTDKPAILDISLTDQGDSGLRWTRWNGVYTSDFKTQSSEVTNLFLDLNALVNSNDNFNSSGIKSLEIRAYPNPQIKDSIAITKVETKAGYLDAGIEHNVDNYSFIKQFGKLKLYELKKYQDFPEANILSEIRIVDKATTMLYESAKLPIINGKVGYIIETQNKDFSLTANMPLQDKVIINKISDDKYIVEADSSVDQFFLVLHKNFNSMWKIIPEIADRDLDGGILNDIKLTQKLSINESNHFMINGYANLWKINNKNKKYAIIFMPQLFVNIFLKISLIISFAITMIVIYSLVKLRHVNN